MGISPPRSWKARVRRRDDGPADLGAGGRDDGGNGNCERGPRFEFQFLFSRIHGD
jgi:hypothetical protein